jgi:hypothetical protein
MPIREPESTSPLYTTGLPGPNGYGPVSFPA